MSERKSMASRLPNLVDVTAPSRILRKAECSCHEAGDASAQCSECLKKRSLQRSAIVDRRTIRVPPIVENVLQSPGRPLDVRTRSFFEPRFGHDFSRVRVHTDANAVDSVNAVDALAYTVGDHIVLGRGEHDLSTLPRLRLLAHELTHVVQQSRSAAATNASPGVSRSNDPAEIEAEATARVLAGDASRSPRQRSSVALQRQEKQTTTKPSDHPPTQADAQPAEEDLVEAALLALGRSLQTVAAPEAEALRGLYNIGKLRIDAERLNLIAKGVAESDLARRLADMRFDLAMDVRKTGSALMRRGAELIDAVRGQGRPTYETLRLVKTDAQIIESASKTNAWVNRLPRGLKWTGRGLWFVSIGLSIYVVISAPPDQRSAVAQKEIEGLAGGAAGAAIGEGLCFVVGIATEGLGLIVCGLLGGIAGAETARKGNLLQVLDIAPHDAPEVAGRIYRVEGTWKEIDLLILSIPQRTVSAAENVLVVATGKVSGEEIGGRGHYHSYEVTPANDAAVKLFGGKASQFVPQYLLIAPTSADLAKSGE